MKKRTEDRKNVTRRQAVRRALGSVAFTLIAGTSGRTLGADPTAPTTAAAEGLSLTSFDQIEPQKFAWGWIRWLMNSKIDPAAEMTIGIVQLEAHTANPLHFHPQLRRVPARAFRLLPAPRRQAVGDAQGRRHAAHPQGRRARRPHR